MLNKRSFKVTALSLDDLREAIASPDDVIIRDIQLFNTFIQNMRCPGGKRMNGLKNTFLPVCRRLYQWLSRLK